MILKLVGQLLLASSLVNLVPVDAATLEWRAGVSGEVPVFTTPLRFATLPLAKDRIQPPKKVDLDSYGIVTSAASAIVVDSASGAVLFTKRPDDQRAIGSITKLMSVLVFLDTKPNITSRVTLVGDDYVAGGRVYLRFDDKVYLNDVLKAILIGSDNTAANALARLSGMTEEEFVGRMNAKAQELGMASTTFTDLTGIGGLNLSTARDLTLLLAAAERNDVMGSIMPMPSVMVRQESGYEVEILSTDELLDGYLNQNEYSIVAAKTGYIPQAGYCLASTILHGDNAIRIVALGADTKADRFSDVKGLATWAFSTYSWE